MYDYPLTDDLRFKYHYNMNRFSPYHACVKTVFGMFRYSVLEAILGDFLGGSLQSVTDIDIDASVPSPSKRLRT